MTAHKNVIPNTKRCEAKKSGFYGKGDQCTRWATYAVLRGGYFKYLCTKHYDREADHYESY